MNKNTRNTLIVGAVVGAGALIYLLKDKKDKEKSEGGGGGSQKSSDVTPSSSVVYGCTDPDAENYDASANNSNNSCEYSKGCTEASALNYDSQAFLDDGSCQFEGVDPTASPVYGCTDSLAQNYNPNATIGDDSCEYLEGCKNPSATNYNPSAIIDDGSCQFGSTPAQEDAEYVFGCVDPKADSFYDDVDIQVIENGGQVFVADNQQCTYDTTGGCTSPSADNFDANAKYDDGSCTFTELSDAIEQGTAQGNYLIGCTDSSADDFLTAEDVVEGQQLVSDNAQCTYNTTGGCTSPVADNYDSTALFDNGTCTFEDLPQEVQMASSSDFYLIGCTNTLADEYITAEDLTGNQVLAPDASLCTFQNTSGCMMENALNYNSEALFDDGTCDFDTTTQNPVSVSYIPVCADPSASNDGSELVGTELAPGVIYAGDNSQCNYTSGCTDADAINYDPEAYNDDFSCIFSGGYSGSTLVTPNDAQRIFLNCFGEDTGSNALLDFLSGYGSEIPLIDIQELTRAQDGENCFLTTEDVLPPANVMYQEFCNDVNATNTGSSEEIMAAGNYPVTNNSLCDYTGVVGCTDPNAENYLAGATIDDESCTYDYLTENIDTGLPYNEIYVEVCTDPAADNTDDTGAIIENGQIPVTNNSICIFDNAYGCTDPVAGNYNSDATIDDGLCDYGFSADVVDAVQYSDIYVVGCTDQSASNALDTENIVGDKIIVTNNDECVYIEGCTDPAANGQDGVGAYDPTAGIDDGSCLYDYSTEIDTSLPADQLYVFGCTDPRASNYENYEEVAEGGQILVSNNEECEYIYGCTDPNALPTSYNPEAGIDNGSCQYPEPDITYGCTDPESLSYNAEAQVDDGSCEYPEDEVVTPPSYEDIYVFGCTDPLANNQMDTEDILANGQQPRTDNSLCEYNFGCTNPIADNYDDTAVIDDNNCTFFEAAGIDTTEVDPISYEDLYVFGCTDELATPESQMDVQGILDQGLVPMTDNDQCDYVYGCTDPQATGNAEGIGAYNPLATIDNGTCLYSNLSTDVESSASYVFECTDPAADNAFTPDDLEEGQVLQSDNSQCIYTYGCTDPEATGDAQGVGAYNPNAGVDDGSCVYADLSDAEVASVQYVFGCTDPAADNYFFDTQEVADGEVLVSNNGTCTYTYGCTAPSAQNYDADAGIDDDSCIFEGASTDVLDVGGNYVPYCMDPLVINQAEIDIAIQNGETPYEDNSLCDYSQLVLGCTDSDAINYNPQSANDDGSCMFSGSVTGDTIVTNEEAQQIITNCNSSWGASALLNILPQIGGTLTLEELQNIALDAMPEAIPCYEFVDLSGPEIADAEYQFYCPITQYPNGLTEEIALLTFGEDVILVPDVDVCEGELMGTCTNPDALNYDVVGTSQGMPLNDSCVFIGMGPNYVVDAQTAYDIIEFTCPAYVSDWNSYSTSNSIDEISLADLNNFTGGNCFEFEGGPVIPEAVAGCTNPDADNYNPEAVVPDGSCTFNNISGCTDPEAENYEATAQYDNGTCTYAPETYGCGDQAATNYDPDADYFVNDLCEYEDTGDDSGGSGIDTFDPNDPNTWVWGCTDPADQFYNVAANIDDGSCKSTGCTKPSACNYNPNSSRQATPQQACLFCPDPMCPPGACGSDGGQTGI